MAAAIAAIFRYPLTGLSPERLDRVSIDAVAPITRCAASEANPQTAARDISVVTESRRHFGHDTLGEPA